MNSSSDCSDGNGGLGLTQTNDTGDVYYLLSEHAANQVIDEIYQLLTTYRRILECRKVQLNPPRNAP